VIDREKALAATMARCGVDLHDIGTDEGLTTALVRMINRRESLIQGRRGGR